MSRPAGRASAGRSLVHLFALAAVWLTIASGAVVFSEPAPVDLLSLGLVVLLPAVGLVRFTPALLMMGGVWLVLAACAFIATLAAVDVARAATHAGISVYLYAVLIVLAGFIMRRPLQHARLVLNAYLAAGCIGALAGLAGSLNLIPGAADVFTLYGRATGAFKDPNVFGAFLVPAVVYAIHRMATRPVLRVPAALAVLALLGAATLLSFSRGAWLNLAIAVAVYGYLSFVTAPTDRQRLRLVGLAGLALIGGIAVIAASLQDDAIGRLLDQRAELSQTYDEGPEGRFGGQVKAWRQALDHPFGIGALSFAPRIHHEDVHNVYISMLLNAGWLGGLLFLAMMLITAAAGLRHAFRRTLAQPLFLVAYAAFIGVAAEGVLIDTDHWRHLYVILALVWGLMLGDRALASRSLIPAVLRGRALVIRPSRAPRILGVTQRKLPARPPGPRRRLPTRPARILTAMRRSQLN